MKSLLKNLILCDILNNTYNIIGKPTKYEEKNFWDTDEKYQCIFNLHFFHTTSFDIQILMFAIFYGKLLKMAKRFSLKNQQESEPT